MDNEDSSIRKMIENHPLNKCMKRVLEDPSSNEYWEMLDKEILEFAAKCAAKEEDEFDELIGSAVNGADKAVSKLVCTIVKHPFASMPAGLSNDDMKEMFLKLKCMTKIMKEVKRIRDKKQNA